jgi:predicted metallo-beta-lactamase superfamily hydrolase
MNIEILGTESLGVRGLSCVVEVKDRRIVIDPGLALGYQRMGLLPHPAQVAIGEQVRRRLMEALREATDVVMSHFHGDHVPLPNANPYQLKVTDVAHLLRTTSFWARGPGGLSPNMARRRISLSEALGRELPNAEGCSDEVLTFSQPVSHGEPGNHLGRVMMTCIRGEGIVFVHASDIQLIDREAVSLILRWEPDIVLVGGPPIYLSSLLPGQRNSAWSNAKYLARHVDTLIIDHHLLRCEEGLSWLDRLSSETGHRVICAADFMERPCCLLEARRVKLYEEMPVPDGWHDAYTRGDVGTHRYRDYREKCGQSYQMSSGF